MNENDLPKKIAVFPLSNAIFFPGTILPLNIFEDRYIKLVNDCMKSNKMFGMIQPKKKIGKLTEVYNIGCLGKIVNFDETSDNRFIISLSGLVRFRIKNEFQDQKSYRKFEVDYSEFLNDLVQKQNNITDYNKKNLLNKIKTFFKKIDYPVNYNELLKLDFHQLVNTVTMISPFSVEEKQKLIETIEVKDKIKILDEILSFNLADFQENKTVQ